MEKSFIYTTSLDAIQSDFFNETRFKEWYNILAIFSVEYINTLTEKIGNIIGIQYEINYTLLREVVYDAMIGLQTVVTSKNNGVEKPNPFKIAAYLGYWFIRHKPIYFRTMRDFDIENLTPATPLQPSEIKEVINNMKHANEYVAATFLLRYIFDTSQNPVCEKYELQKVKRTGCFYFENFEDMLRVIHSKLKYHLTYREISPKVIEHILEAYTLHPYAPYTSDFWNPNEEKDAL